jgi:hypothetical protein
MFERLLEPGCTESPTCHCGKEMEISAIESLPEGTDAGIRLYRCKACHREMRLTVWAAIAPLADASTLPSIGEAHLPRLSGIE